MGGAAWHEHGVRNPSRNCVWPSTALQPISSCFLLLLSFGPLLQSPGKYVSYFSFKCLHPLPAPHLAQAFLRRISPPATAYGAQVTIVIIGRKTAQAGRACVERKARHASMKGTAGKGRAGGEKACKQVGAGIGAHYGTILHGDQRQKKLGQGAMSPVDAPLNVHDTLDQPRQSMPSGLQGAGELSTAEAASAPRQLKCW